MTKVLSFIYITAKLMVLQIALTDLFKDYYKNKPTIYS